MDISTEEVEPLELERLACLEIRGGNRLAVYSAELPGLNAWISSRPLLPAVRGGDLHYLSVCSGGVVSRVVLADVAGHGEVVGSIAERLKDALRLHADSWDQSVLIQNLNNTFLRGSGQDGPGGLQYATALVLSYHDQSKELLFTNAGHSIPLWFRADLERWFLLEDSIPNPVEVTDLPLGLIPGTSYTMTEIRMAPGDLLVLYTDGITESTDDSGEQLGLEGLLAMARQSPVHSPDAAGRALLAAVEAFRGHTTAADDETLVVLQFKPLQPA
jgi:serine phosphatase RsbU (regulator of sigma subunit)